MILHDAFIGRQERVGMGGPTLLDLGAFFRWEGHVSCIGKENHGVDGDAEVSRGLLIGRAWHAPPYLHFSFMQRIEILSH